jgi:hypothetical protein
MINPLSSQAQQHQVIDNRLNARAAEEDSCFTTALKVVGVAFLLIAAIAAFAVAGPIVGVVALVLLMPLALIFNACWGNPSHQHSSGNIPWHQRAFTWIPRSGPHVPVGRGHMNDPRNVGRSGNIAVGGGHQRWGDENRRPRGSGHVAVGGRTLRAW